MPETRVLSLLELPVGEKKVVKVADTEILLIHHEGGLAAVQPQCPHAGAPLEKAAVCNGRLVCPWHLGTFALPSGDLLEPPAMEPLKTYRVRVEDQSIFVDPELLPRAETARRQTSWTPVFLLIGAGAAGAMAATTLRQGGFTGRIIAVDPVPEEPVDRTQLSKMALSGDVPLEKIRLDIFARLDVERLTASVTRLSAATQTACLSNGLSINFDRALVATGGKPKRLEIPGAELAHTIRHADDVREILEAAGKSTRVVIIGTSFIGLEAASALVQKGHQVTVVGRETLPFSKQFGGPVALALKKLHESNGTRFHLGADIVRITAEGVTIRTDGKENLVEGEICIMGTGVNPKLDFEHDLQFAESGSGIKTDKSLRTASCIWAAGDIANVDGVRIEHWRVAQQHGRIAALGMLGQDARYDGIPFFWTYHYSKRLGYLGHMQDWDQTFVKGDLASLEFMVLYAKEGRLKAVMNCGFESETAFLSELMRKPILLADALRTLPS
jgi:NADPH-dependent 2,4-dienoyl-CoA reductase/sulfur reductase-like enzyme/nitrite reductase/ring-hydroxylating ferredoxin subunit